MRKLEIVFPIKNGYKETKYDTSLFMASRPS